MTKLILNLFLLVTSYSCICQIDPEPTWFDGLGLNYSPRLDKTHKLLINGNVIMLIHQYKEIPMRFPLELEYGVKIRPELPGYSFNLPFTIIINGLPIDNKYDTLIDLSLEKIDKSKFYSPRRAYKHFGFKEALVVIDTD